MHRFWERPRAALRYACRSSHRRGRDPGGLANLDPIEGWVGSRASTAGGVEGASVDEEEWFEHACERMRSVVSPPATALDRPLALAFHEAGHAVVDHENGLEVARVRIGDFDGRPEGRAHASARVAEAVLDGWSQSTARPVIEGAVAGILAEAGATATPIWADAYADLVLAKQLADDVCSTEEEAVAFVDECIEGANRILTERWSSVTAIAKLLAYQGEITGAELKGLLPQGSLR